MWDLNWDVKYFQPHSNAWYFIIKCLFVEYILYTFSSHVRHVAFSRLKFDQCSIKNESRKTEFIPQTFSRNSTFLWIQTLTVLSVTLPNVKVHLGLCELCQLPMISVMGAVFPLCGSISAQFLCIKRAVRMKLKCWRRIAHPDSDRLIK